MCSKFVGGIDALHSRDILQACTRAQKSSKKVLCASYARSHGIKERKADAASVSSWRIKQEIRHLRTHFLSFVTRSTR